jgi:L-threonylcarbamoyladenylate synthase
VALRRLEEGGLVAYPTETVWGLAALATDERSMAALRAWKGRGESHPVSVLVTGAAAVARLGYELGAAGEALARDHWPGPLTLVARPGPDPVPLAAGIAREDGAVGFRCSPHPAAAILARATEARGVGPVTATSLNRSGEPPARTRSEAQHLCRGEGAPLPWPAADTEAHGDAPSTVVDVTGPRSVVLREGAIASDRIRSHTEEATATASAVGNSEEQPNP